MFALKSHKSIDGYSNRYPNLKLFKIGEKKARNQFVHLIISSSGNSLLRQRRIEIKIRIQYRSKYKIEYIREKKREYYVIISNKVLR